ncbi:type II toxin-antitoxin system Phd/YefM family antitoxin [Kitasatospora sp. NPDC058046]|uniref:type II toxin-antitoxin system Phd/YefM family antitoxin n=1 Tax=Kitasatospora sp. NPDC058046 TaxID=3346312 RepID=UPI0036DB1DAC
MEEARERWAELVAAAGVGTTVLVARQDASGLVWYRLTELVPLSEAAVPLEQCRPWSLSSARPKLSDLVAAATDFPGAAPQVLTRHRRPVAALVAAIDSVDQPDGGERIDVESFLQGGGTVQISSDPGRSGAVNEDGSVTQDPVEECFIVTAHDHTGTKIGYGAGHSVAEAMLRLHRPPPTPATPTNRPSRMPPWDGSSRPTTAKRSGTTSSSPTPTAGW